MQHIDVNCPSCGATFKLNPEMRGKRMRCPNSLCREAFVVQETSPPDPTPKPSEPEEPVAVAPPKKNQTVGAVGEIVPFLTSELASEAVVPAVAETTVPPTPIVSEVVKLLPADPVAPPAASEPPSWQEPPPVRQPKGKPAVPPIVRRPTKTPVPGPKPPLWEEQPPPVRRNRSPNPRRNPGTHRRRSGTRAADRRRRRFRAWRSRLRRRPLGSRSQRRNAYPTNPAR